MSENTQVKLFEDKLVRTIWDKDSEEWFFSVVDVIAVLTESPNPNNYWKVLKNRLKKEGSELVTNCNQLKMRSTDGKMYRTDCLNTEQLFLRKLSRLNFGWHRWRESVLMKYKTLN